MDEVKIGDEIQSNNGDTTYVVTEIYHNSYKCLHNIMVRKDAVHKTGKHFSWIARTIKQMRKE